MNQGIALCLESSFASFVLKLPFLDLDDQAYAASITWRDELLQLKAQVCAEHETCGADVAVLRAVTAYGFRASSVCISPLFCP